MILPFYKLDKNDENLCFKIIVFISERNDLMGILFYFIDI